MADSFAGLRLAGETEGQKINQESQGEQYGTLMRSLYSDRYPHVKSVKQRIVREEEPMESARASGLAISKQIARGLWQSVATCSGIALLTFGGHALGLDLSAIGFVYLLFVVAVALFFGFWQASLASILAAVCLDYYFTIPLYRFAIAAPQDWIALGTFQATALVISRLTSRELRSKREAALHRMEMEKLYELSRNSLLLDLRQPPGQQLAVLIHRVFDVEAVALYDVNLGREDCAGDWGAGGCGAESGGPARKSFGRDADNDDPQDGTAERILQTGSGSVGSLVLRGRLTSLVTDALASLAAIVIDRHRSFENEERAENARKIEQLRGAVMDALAHEFKTPLTAVQAASSGLLELGGLNEPQEDLARLINEEAICLNRLCTRLLQTAQLDAPEVGLEMSDVNVHELIDEVLGARRNDQADRIEVTLDDPGLTVRVDRQLLSTILAQYIDNAHKYSSPRTPIQIAARRSHSEVVISVHNFGLTIPIEDREEVFERFYRSPAHRDATPGTGIGLSIVKKAAEAHHGHVWVISDEKEGTTFFLSIPTGTRRRP